VTGSGTPHLAVAGPGFPRVALGLAWICSALAVGTIGWLLIVVSDRRSDGRLGGVLLGLAIVGVMAAATVASNRRRALTLAFSTAGGILFVMAGLVLAIVVATRDEVFVAPVLLAAAVPVVSGVIITVLSRRARQMSMT
jgi:hypothetical protein